MKSTVHSPATYRLESDRRVLHVSIQNDRRAKNSVSVKQESRALTPAMEIESQDAERWDGMS